MVFHCRCFSLSFQLEEEEEEEEEEVEIEEAEITQSTSTTTFYHTAYSNFYLPNPEAEKTSNLRVFTFAELKAATKDFDDAHRLDDGTHGSVYRGVIKTLERPFHKIRVAIKDTNQKMGRWGQQISHLVVVEHPNFAKPIGHCLECNGFEDGEGSMNNNNNRIPWLLVYEYMMPNRSVAYHLSTRSQTPLSWNIRLKVAQDVARGLAYLHQQTNFQITFGFFTSSNIFLDNQWNAKLWNYWFARFHPKEGFSRVISMVTDKGYMAPEIQTGDLPSTRDVWSYGVFLYELITGTLRLPLDTNRTKNEQELIIDPRLKGNYSLESAQKLSVIANKCLSIDPESRPKMSDALEMVNQLITPVPSPLNSLVSVVAIEPKMVFTHVKKTPQKMKSEGERGSTQVQHKERGSTQVQHKKSPRFSRMCCLS